MAHIDLVALQQRLAQQQPKPTTPVPAEPPSWSTRPAPASALRTPPAPKARPAAASAAAPAATLRATAALPTTLPPPAGAESTPSRRFGCSTGGHAACDDGHARDAAIESDERTCGT